MLDINFIRDNVAQVKDAASSKRVTIDIDHLLDLDDQRKSLQTSIDTLKFEQKQAGKERNIEKAKGLKVEIQAKQDDYVAIKEQLDLLLLKVPQILHPDVPAGTSEEDNVEMYIRGEKPNFDFDTLDHVTLMKNHDMIDVERAVKLAGARNYFLKGDGALLEQAVLQYAFQKIVAK